MDEQDDLIAQFRGIADTTEERARFYLESAQWQLPVALSSFYDTGAADHAGEMDVDLHPAEIADEQPPHNPYSTGSSQDAQPQAGGAMNTRSKKTSKFASIRDLNEEESHRSDEEEGQRFYAGGSEHSGELIVGPPRKKQSNEEIAKSLFSEAKKHGAQSVEAGSKDAGKSGDSSARYFTGGGYKLGETDDTSQFVPSREQPQPQQPVNVTLRLWSNGFTVDDGPLRDFNDPANADFLSSIKKGEIPRELLRNAQGGEVHVDMEDHRQEEYKAPKKKMTPFTGQGHMLGSPAPEFTSSSSQSVQKSSSSVDPPVVVDKSKPTTIIQIRLSDGKRLKQEFNHSHRVSDIRSFVVNSHPDAAVRPFVLMTTFPNKVLTDESVTLSEAKLLNALVVQKLV